jgi:hypothetical protein
MGVAYVRTGGRYRGTHQITPRTEGASLLAPNDDPLLIGPSVSPDAETGTMVKVPGYSGGEEDDDSRRDAQQAVSDRGGSLAPGRQVRPGAGS